MHRSLSRFARVALGIAVLAMAALAIVPGVIAMVQGQSAL